MNPLVFVAKENLYVISEDDEFRGPVPHRFEMYSPSTNSWTVLNYGPKGPYDHGHGTFKSHVVLDDTVYFATFCVEDCYNVTHHSWKHLSTFPTVDCFSYNLKPAFESPVVPIGNMLFGGFSNFSTMKTVAASPYSELNDSDFSAKAMFMRPTLAPEPDFWIEYSRCDDYVFPLSCTTEHCITDLRTLEGQNVLCIVFYGHHPTLDDTVAFFNFFLDDTVAFFNVFKIPGVYHSDPPVPLEEEPKDAYDFCYYAKQVDSGIAVKSYFKSEFMHHKLFKISTDELLVHPNRIIACFSY